MYYKIAQLMLTPGKKASTVSDIFIAQPDVIKESLAGKLFILFEIESKKVDSLKVINFLIDNINYHYYQSEKIILREKITSLKVEHIFEDALAKTNKNFG
jgi:nucleoside diphosphate kinase